MQGIWRPQPDETQDNLAFNAYPARHVIPSPKSIAAELDTLVRRRGDGRLAADGALLGLAIVRDRAADIAPHVRMAGVAQVLPQVAAQLRDPPRAAAVLALISLDGPLRRAAVGTRRQAAANALGMAKGDSFRRRHEARLLADLGQAFVAVETAYRHRRQVEERGIDWIARFEAYGRVYTPISGLRGDLEILVRAQLEKPDEFDYLIAQLGSSLWFYTRFLLAIDRLVADYGGLWLLSEADAETDIANAIQHINRDTAMSEPDCSWLRIVLRETVHHELDPFLETISVEPRGKAILGAWADWCRSCRCPSVAVPQRQCEVHAVIAACADYIAVMDRELRELGQPERERMRAVPVEDVREVIKRFGPVRDA